MIVKCINDKFDEENKILKAIKLVGDDYLIPKLDQEYEVIGYGDFKKRKGYLLKEIDTSIYGARLFFNEDNFMIIDDSFMPNIILEDGHLAREVLLYMEININK